MAGQTAKPEDKRLVALQDKASKGNAVAQNELGDKLYEAGEQQASLEWYMKSALQGNKDALYSVGWAYYAGEGCPQDHGEAAEWFERAIEAGHPKGMRVMAKMLYTGSGGTKDIERAKELWQKSSDLGDPEAAITFGKILMEGAPGVEKDQARACKHLRRAGEAGDPDAMYRLHIAYKEGHGVDVSEQEARMWLVRAQQNGYVTPEARKQQGASIYAQAVMHYTGQGVQRDIPKAIQLFVAAAQRGHPSAAGNVANFYLAGLPFAGMETPNYQEAHQWAVRALQWGETDAAYTLGQIYEMGHDVPADFQIAVHWYLTCIQAKDIKDDGDHRAKFKSMNALGRCYYKAGKHDAADSKVDPDFKKAMYWWRRAANEGKSADAMNHLGDMYYKGTGVPRDLSKAKEWWTKASSLGHLEAAEGLNSLAPKSIGQKLRLWIPMIILFLMLLAVFFYFGYKYHEMANDSWFQRNNPSDDTSASTTADTTTAPSASPSAAGPDIPLADAGAGAAGAGAGAAGAGIGSDQAGAAGAGSGSAGDGDEL